MSTQNTQMQLLGGPSGESATITTSGRTIRPALALPNALIDECKLNFTPDGLHIQAVDPSNVALITLDIHADAFEDYQVDAEDDVLVGVNLTALTSKLANARLGKRTDDPVRLDVDETRTVVEIERDYTNTSARYADEQLNIDPDSIREEPEIPDLGLPATATLDVDAFQDAVDHLTADKYYVTFRDRGNDLVLTTNAHDDSPSEYGSAVEFTDVLDIDEDVPDGDLVSLFSGDYLEKITRALKSGKVDTVDVRFGEEFPTKIAFSREEDDTTLYEGEYMLAPRISSGDDV